MSEDGDGARVLVVDDERDLADVYAAFLPPEHEVHVAYGGEEALELLDVEPDVVFLDRRMPDLSGDEVLEALRERGSDARVAMVTAVDPDFDIIALPFDEYLVKPVSRDELVETLEELLLVEEFDEALVELSRKRVTRTTLELEKSQPELVESDEYNRLLEEIADLEDEVAALEARFDEGPEGGE